MPRPSSAPPTQNLKPQYLANTLAFMFETQWAVRPTEFAMNTRILQHEYFECWQGLKKHFDFCGPENWRIDEHVFLGTSQMTERSWVASANDPGTDFPLQNLPFGVFRQGGRDRIGVAIGDRILDLDGCAQSGLLSALPKEILAACSANRLNSLMALGAAAWSAVRRQLTGSPQRRAGRQ